MLTSVYSPLGLRVPIVAKEKPESELKRLRNEQYKTRQDEVFGGLSPAERTEYNRKRKRINDLEIELAASAGAKKSTQSATAEQRRQWNKNSETDTPQDKAQQPYRNREKDSGEPFRRSEKEGRRGKEPDRRRK